MASIKLKIRRRPLQGNFTSCFLTHFPLPKQKIDLPENYGVMTSCSGNLFIGLQLMLSSLTHFYNVKTLVLDVGMTEEQVAWCQQQPNVTVKQFPLPKCPDFIHPPGAWFKAHYIRSSPFVNTIWIDADTMIVGDLRELIRWSQPQALFTSDHSGYKAGTLNKRELYQHLPLNNGYPHDIEPYINTGVFVLNKKRDYVILDDWCYCVEMACQNEKIAKNLSCWDQGACKWALHRTHKLYLITPDRKFNFPAPVRHYAYPTTPAAVEHLIRNAKTQQCVILHWMGSPKPWHRWGEMLNLNLKSG